MVGIQGIGGIPEPKPERPAKVRENSEQTSAARSPSSDGVLISSEAQAAAKIARMIQTAGQGGDVRTERIEAAREHLERGDYKKPDVVAKVAERISKYLP